MKKNLIFLLCQTMIIIFGCADSTTSGGDDPGLYISADLTPEWEGEVNLIRNYTEYPGGAYSGDWVTSGTVSMDDTPFSVDSNDVYTGSFGVAAFSAGDSVDLAIASGSVTVNSTLTIPGRPVVTTPSGGSASYTTGTIDLAWNALSPEPDSIIIYVSSLDTVSGYGDYEISLAGNATSHTIPSGVIDAPFLFNSEIRIITRNRTALSGSDVDSRSYYRIQNYYSVWISP